MEILSNIHTSKYNYEQLAQWLLQEILVTHLCILQVCSFNEAIESLVKDLEKGLLGLLNLRGVLQILNIIKNS